MLSIRNGAALADALASSLDPILTNLLRQRRDQLQAHAFGDIGELAHFLIVQAGDDLAAIEREVGLSLLSNPVDGSRYGEPGFEPFWEWIERHGGWFELTFILSDDGFGIVLFVEDHEGAPVDLLHLCRAYAGQVR